MLHTKRSRLVRMRKAAVTRKSSKLKKGCHFWLVLDYNSMGVRRNFSWGGKVQILLRSNLFGLWTM